MRASERDGGNLCCGWGWGCSGGVRGRVWVGGKALAPCALALGGALAAVEAEVGVGARCVARGAVGAGAEEVEAADTGAGGGGCGALIGWA